MTHFKENEKGGREDTIRYILATILILAVWTTFTIWQITVRESYDRQTRQDAPGRAQGVREVDSTISTLANDMDNLAAEVDRLVGSQRESVRRLKTISRGEGEMLMLATGYTHVAKKGVADINGSGDGLTAIGVPVHEGVVAVDPAIIPLGSMVYVKSDYPGITGYYRAIDTGGAIKGLRIDIFMEDGAAAAKFKRRVRVRILAAEGVK